MLVSRGRERLDRGQQVRHRRGSCSDASLPAMWASCCGHQLPFAPRSPEEQSVAKRDNEEQGAWLGCRAGGCRTVNLEARGLAPSVPPAPGFI